MGTGIGINCRRCGKQLDYKTGFNLEKQLCSECENITNYNNSYYEPQRNLYIWEKSPFGTIVVLSTSCNEALGQIDWDLGEEICLWYTRNDPEEITNPVTKII